MRAKLRPDLKHRDNREREDQEGKQERGQGVNGLAEKVVWRRRIDKVSDQPDPGADASHGEQDRDGGASEKERLHEMLLNLGASHGALRRLFRRGGGHHHRIVFSARWFSGDIGKRRFGN